jgi:hypothetical protein
MKIRFESICLLAVCLFGLVLNAYAADKGVLNLVKPIVPPDAAVSVKDSSGKQTCQNSLVLQKNGQCCPAGTNNDVWKEVCTPDGTVDGQIFNGVGGNQYCPNADMFIVSNKTGNWFSCAASDSKAFYTAAIKYEGSRFCLKHGYGFLIKIKPWGTVGCIKYGDSQGDGCIEAGTCSYVSGSKK